MNRKKVRVMFIIVAVILCFWMLLTLWVQYSGKQKLTYVGNINAPRKALLVYNPDPIYNLDEQVSLSFAAGLAEYGFYSKIATIDFAKIDLEDYDLFVFCANTYNWAPDWLVTNYIEDRPNLENRNIIGITLGSGSTGRAKRLLEKAIKSRNSNLLDSKTYWLLRPNDDDRIKDKNTEVANDLVKAWAKEIGKQL